MNNPITVPASEQASQPSLKSASEKSGSLGNTTSFAATPSPSGKTGLDGRSYRYFCQASARALLPSERVSWCLRRVKPGAGEVDVTYNPERKRARYGNVMQCGSVWGCSVCAARITEVRKDELQQQLDLAQSLGYRVLMVTLTLQHGAWDALQVLLDALLQAYRFLMSQRSYKALKAALGLVGYIRAVEVTYGENGWHPHLHILFFFKNAPTPLLDVSTPVPSASLLPSSTLLPSPNPLLDAFSSFFRKSWPESLRHFGRDASWTYGVDVRDTYADVSDYVAKFGHDEGWSAAHELTKHPTKQAARGGYTVNQLLYLFGMGEAWAGELYKEYYRAFKGKKQLVRALPPELTLPEKSDEECLDEDAPTDVVLASLSLSEWQRVVGLDVRAELLNVADGGSVEAVNEFLRSIGIVR